MKLEKVIGLMLAGRVFRVPGLDMMYKDNAFMFKTSGSLGHIQSFVDAEKWELVTEWYDNISKEGIFCKVGNTNTNTNRLIRSYTNGNFYDDDGIIWENAIPLRFNKNQFVGEFE